MSTCDIPISLMAKKAAALAGPDTLSKLPDELLLVIISLLRMEDAVRTSVLSKRWRYLYASRSDLDFDFNIPSVPTDVMDVVDRVFVYRKSCPINKFCFRMSKFEAFDPCRLEGWIKSVICHGIREITLDIHSGLVLPSNLFTCETLVKLSLSLSMGYNVEVPAKVFLPSLKFLSLSTVISFHKDDDAVERLLSNCPALEKLECFIRDSECRLVVSSPTLKLLHVIDRRSTTSGVIRSFEIVINAPNLVRLGYFVFDVNSHRLINAKSLTDASLSFFCEDGGNVDNWVVAATDLIRGISGVQSLSIAGPTLDYCLGLNIPLPVFHNTTYLRISDGALDSFSDLLYVLTFFESLESLSLEEPPSKFDLDDGYELEESRASCLSFRLKEISFSGFKGDESEMKMVEYFLENAKVLEVLETDIYEGGCDDELDIITKKLLVFPRASDKCKVVVSSHRVDEEDYE